MEAIKDFSTKHKVITERITETYRIGNQMMDYLEKQIILDHHFRGEQDLFEQEYPHLKQKALELLGQDIYFDCSPLTGAALSETEQPELFASLMKIQASITTDLDEQVYKHYVKIDEMEEVIEASEKKEKNAQVIDGGQFYSIEVDDDSPFVTSKNEQEQR